MPSAPAPAAAELLELARRSGTTIGVAESLTGGLVTAALVAVPGASDVLRGGVTAYATDLKTELLGVDRALLAEHGPVHPDVARAMAEGVALRTGALAGLATTGVAGPGPQDGHPAGTVHVAVSTAARTVVRSLRLDGGRDDVRLGAVRAVLALAVEELREQSAPDDR
ncbi:competence damage-inducible protein A [Sediminihabitans luteus]|nr:CinA family protein [Sediminihabitans luteus]GII99421.1 competence damage-inducible protein A [Sediminihabitans luteus]